MAVTGGTLTLNSHALSVNSGTFGVNGTTVTSGNINLTGATSGLLRIDGLSGRWDRGTWLGSMRRRSQGPVAHLPPMRRGAPGWLRLSVRSQAKACVAARCGTAAACCQDRPATGQLCDEHAFVVVLAAGVQRVVRACGRTNKRDCDHGYDERGATDQHSRPDARRPHANYLRRLSADHRDDNARRPGDLYWNVCFVGPRSASDYGRASCHR